MALINEQIVYGASASGDVHKKLLLALPHFFHAVLVSQILEKSTTL